MDSLLILVPLSVFAVIVIGWVFWRALEGGQFDDLDRPGYQVLDDDDRLGGASGVQPRGASRMRRPPGDIDRL